MMAAAASNSRPTALLVGAFTLRRQASSESGGAGLSNHSIPASQHNAAALRQGARPAPSPPGNRNGRKLATRRQSPGSPKNVSPPQSVPSSPNPAPSQANTSAGRLMPASVMSAEA